MPTRRAGHRSAGCLPGSGGGTAADAHRSGFGSGIRPTRRFAASAGDRRRRAAGSGDGARGHRLCLATWRRRGVRARGRADHVRRSRNPDVEPVGQRRGWHLKMTESKRPSPEEIILYAKDPKTKIATITFNRPEFLNAPTSAARLRYADLLHGANVDDDVKVVIIRGVGDDLEIGRASCR